MIKFAFAILIAVFSIASMAESQSNVDQFWQSLRSHSLLTNQESISNRTDLCGAASAVNLVQAVVAASIGNPDSDPHTTFEDLVKVYRPTGKTELSGVLQAIEYLKRQKSGLRNLAVHTKLLNGFRDSDMSNIDSVDTFAQNDLSSHPQNPKLMLIVVADKWGHALYQHYILIENYDGKLIRYVDPNSPNVEGIARYVEPATVRGITAPRFSFLVLPGLTEGEDSFVPLAIISAKLSE